MGTGAVGVLVMRAWIEEGSQRPLRVEVRVTADSGRGFEREVMFSEQGQVEQIVRAWLADVLAGDDQASRSADPTER
jgi:hypothetical protein